jgi:hypothetical protein
MVGYGDEKKKYFWKLKSSFGTSWGEVGYLRIEKNKDGKGICSVQEELYAPIA